ncbi:A disintegrin and metalloproteinase with thrombospondin motifs 15-like [Eucyclogobius newberryi]|uniref:A disintegrin and metalloproteinase with thrombospondin motifs 15-like n=1 Tax=Eucyclogobius newberryi TaxID=166745 RepID=UPI003B5A77BB
MFIRIPLLLYLALTSSRLVCCMESELCFPVRLKHHNHDRRTVSDNDVDLSSGKSVVKIRAFHQELLLDLHQDSSFMSPSISNQDAPNLPNGDVTHELRRCFYSGHVNDDSNSYAALSLCNGLHGAFGFHGWEYFIAPVQNDTNTAESAHILRRRTSRNLTPNATSRCAVDSDISQQLVQSLEKYRHFADDNNVTETMRRLGRSKRFASVPRYVETLVAADESMAQFHGDDLKHYILTLMSVAARLYKHPSILNSINIVVVKIIVVTEADKGPKVSTNAAMTLRNFCTWQKKMNKNTDKHAEYWDTAILLTREDLCGASTCDTLGMADVGTMCDPKRSCSVIEDDGLPSAFTTAHELGHVFNMPHDNVKACDDVFGKLLGNHMMSPTLIQINRTSPWSPCSAAIITEFLDGGHGDCLLDPPQKPLVLHDVLPGLAYSLDRQCELAFGEESKPCTFMLPPCGRLWCTGKSNGHPVCMTRHFPWADGTPCGEGQICDRGICTNKMEVQTVKEDGRWAKWGAFGPCSRSCGGGVQLSKRECNSPAPSNGGKYCQGVRVKYRSCSLNHCPDNGKTFREEQCEASGHSFNNNRIAASAVWVPKFSGVSANDRCKLICRANGTGYFYVLAPKVVDGTPCSPDTTGVCVQGKCIKAGCDGRIGSAKKFDKCGVCGGDNKGCKKVSGLFTKPMHGYNFVVMLPVGAANIDIRQRGYKGMTGDDNYLAVKSSNGQYMLNGNYVVSSGERDIIIKNSLMHYSGTSGSSETLQAVKPLGEALTVEVLCAGRMTPPRIRYSFYLPRQTKEDKVSKKDTRANSQNSVLAENDKDRLKDVYNKEDPGLGKWLSTNWDKCSVTCGNGLQRRLVQCLRPDGKPGFDCEPTQRPSATRSCGDPCPEWRVGNWSPCSRTCGKGFKRRPLDCRAQRGHLLPREHCIDLRKPQELDFCNLSPC